jgi:hypothetical protein
LNRDYIEHFAALFSVTINEELRTHKMFRNILPTGSRRQQDAQHDEVENTGSTGPTPSTSDKENHPQQPSGSSLRIMGSQPVLFPGLPNTPREKRASTPTAYRDHRALDRDVLVENGGMHIAFDKMLVRT